MSENVLAIYKQKRKSLMGSIKRAIFKNNKPNRLGTILSSPQDQLKANRPLHKKKWTLLETRRQQMQEFVNDDISEAQKEANQIFWIASINLGIAGMSLFYTPLLWLVVPITAYANTTFFRHAYKSVVQERRITSYVTSSILILGTLIGGYFYTAVIAAWHAACTAKLLRHNESNCKNNMSNLFGTQPRFVWVQTNDGISIEIPFEQLQIGDIVIVSAGQMIAVDGVIVSGMAAIDQRKLTGESQPVEKSVGDEVLASTVVLTGSIGIRTEKTGQETVAMQIGQLLEDTTDFKNSLQSQGEAIADRLAPMTLGLSALFLPIFGFSSALAVMTNEFGYRMRMFAPASVLAFLNISSAQGILIKDGRSLDLLNQIDTVVFDKTGTLTMEQPTISKIYTFHGISKDDVLRYAAVAEEGQTHPIAKAILATVRTWQFTNPETSPVIVNAKYEMGYGIQVNLQTDHKSAKTIRVGSDKFMIMNNIDMPLAIHEIQTHCYEYGHSLVFVAFDDQLAGAIELHATIRPEVQNIINLLHQRNMSIYILSGDHEAPTKTLARKLGIRHYFANTLPENKADIISQLQQQGKSVCFVGDGINDSIALKTAHVSISLRGATTVATDTAQIVFMDGTLRAMEKTFDIAEYYEKKMKSNFVLSTVPSVICVSGIIFLHWGVIAGMAVNIISLSIGVTNAILPLFNQKMD